MVRRLGQSCAATVGVYSDLTTAHLAGDRRLARTRRWSAERGRGSGDHAGPPL